MSCVEIEHNKMDIKKNSDNNIKKTGKIKLSENI